MPPREEALAEAAEEINIYVRMHPEQKFLVEPMFGKRMLLSCLCHVGLIAVGTIGFFLYELDRTDNVGLARTMAVNALVFFQIYYL